jgi:hypothetical protein
VQVVPSEKIHSNKLRQKCLMKTIDYHRIPIFIRFKYLKLKIITKLALVGTQLPEKNKEKLDVSSEGPFSGIS